MEELIVGFDYTIWANKKWVEVLPLFPDTDWFYFCADQERWE